MIDTLHVLDRGYVRLVTRMGDDLTTVNSARVSYDRESDELSKADVRLINFLAKNAHTSPFRHSIIQYEVYAPLLVARQWWKYIVGSDHRDPFTAWNESSRRYISENNEFYIPLEWRAAPQNKKQGSGAPLPKKQQDYWTKKLEEVIANGNSLYNEAIEAGIAPEQARLFVPAYGLYVRWYWTGSLQSVAHFINQRIKSDAQQEIQAYAHAVKELTEKYFEYSLGELLD